MSFETGDIIVFNNGTWGHVAMCYDGGADRRVTFIHARNSGNFHLSSQVSETSTGIYYMVERDCWHFRPASGKILASQKERLREVAAAIARRATYGIYRAIRVALGSSSFGSGARDRLDKYRQRLTAIGDGGGGKLVTTLTCAEAVILCYQLTFDESDPLFIKKDGAHTLPRTLAKYLADSANWQTLVHP